MTSIIQKSSSLASSPTSLSLNPHNKPTFGSLTLCQVLSDGRQTKKKKPLPKITNLDIFNTFIWFSLLLSDMFKMHIYLFFFNLPVFETLSNFLIRVSFNFYLSRITHSNDFMRFVLNSIFLISLLFKDYFSSLEFYLDKLKINVWKTK